MEKTEFVFVPSVGVSHLVPTLEFAKSLIQRDERISITFIIINSPFHSPSDLASSNPSFNFINLPQLNPPDLACKSPEKAFAMFIQQHKSHVKEAITNRFLSDSKSATTFGGLVFDFLCTSMIDVANELGVDSYAFLPCGSALLSLMLYLPDHYTQKGSEFEESDPDSIISGFSNHVPTSVLPSFCFSSEGGYETFLNHGIRVKQTKGIFVNSFSELEEHALSLLGQTPNVPPIYTIGPIIGLSIHKKPESKRDEMIQWLDNQPDDSVVFLCFGSFGSLGETQLSRIATALERNEHRFLWVIRKRLSSNVYSIQGDYDDLSEALPEGFLERTKDRGLVCGGWVPQIEILAHKATGCFVSHCGWNSVLESVWFGKTIVTWPLYAEQQLNAYQLVKELGLAVELALDYRYEKGDQEIVKAEDIENSLKNAMDAENPVRKRVKEMSEIGKKAMDEGGSSSNSISRFLDDFFGKKP